MNSKDSKACNEDSDRWLVAGVEVRPCDFPWRFWYKNRRPNRMPCDCTARHLMKTYENPIFDEEVMVSCWEDQGWREVYEKGIKDIKVCCVTPIQVVQDFFDVTVNIYTYIYIYIQADQQAHFNFSSNLTLHPSEGSNPTGRYSLPKWGGGWVMKLFVQDITQYLACIM